MIRRGHDLPTGEQLAIRDQLEQIMVSDASIDIGAQGDAATKQTVSTKEQEFSRKVSWFLKQAVSFELWIQKHISRLAFTFDQMETSEFEKWYSKSEKGDSKLDFVLSAKRQNQAKTTE